MILPMTTPRWCRYKKVLVTIFIFLNLATVLFMNRPPWIAVGWRKLLIEIHPTLATGNDRAEFQFYRYAHGTGLDARWKMFSYSTHHNWRYEIKAQYADGTEVVLPLARQSPRTFLQNWLFDFRTAKFHLNIYSSPWQRESYARYLCRRYRNRDGVSIDSIIWKRHDQKIFDPITAKARGTHRDFQTYKTILGHYPCCDEGEAR